MRTGHIGKAQSHILNEHLLYFCVAARKLAQKCIKYRCLRCLPGPFARKLNGGEIVRGMRGQLHSIQMQDAVFEVDDDLLIGSSNIKIVKDDKNSLKIVSDEEISKEKLPTILKYQELISSGETMGSYGECNAIVIYNKVVAINTNIK